MTHDPAYEDKLRKEEISEAPNPPNEIVETPEIGRRLDAGNWFIEFELSRPVEALPPPGENRLSRLKEGLLLLGFSNVLFDFHKEYVTTLAKSDDHRRRLSFVGTLQNDIHIVNTSFLQFLTAYKCSIDPFAGLSYQVSHYGLQRNGIYELRFLARTRDRPNLQGIEQALILMGFIPYKICVMERNHKIPGKPNADHSQCFAIARWYKPESQIVADDPLFFEEVKMIYHHRNGEDIAGEAPPTSETHLKEEPQEMQNNEEIPGVMLK